MSEELLQLKIDINELTEKLDEQTRMTELLVKANYSLVKDFNNMNARHDNTDNTFRHVISELMDIISKSEQADTYNKIDSLMQKFYDNTIKLGVVYDNVH